MEKERENHVYLAKLAEQAERYDGMAVMLRGIVSCGKECALV